MNGRCDISDFLALYDSKCCNLCEKCCMYNACFLTMIMGFEHENIIIYSEGE